ncbi:hypothetical protein E2542_SST07262 [Spatholobus suberectus]|nr:hypothetical protein E2542_SST07262 [Spatholobus suberectus]
MDAVVKFPTRAPCHWTGINSNITKRHALTFPPSKRKCNLLSDKMAIQRHNIKKNVLNKSWDRNRISAIANRDSESWQNSLSPAQTVKQYYACINNKELGKLDECISEEACFDDYTFTKPFHGKEEIMDFLKQLTHCMGRNVKFKVRQIYEGDDLTAVANWHLEWKKKQIPFTRGCTFFKLSKEGENMIIWKAEVLIESPIKPGSVVLTLLKNVTSIFDDFPSATDCDHKSEGKTYRKVKAKRGELKEGDGDEVGGEQEAAIDSSGSFPAVYCIAPLVLSPTLWKVSCPFDQNKSDDSGSGDNNNGGGGGGKADSDGYDGVDDSDCGGTGGDRGSANGDSGGKVSGGGDIACGGGSSASGRDRGRGGGGDDGSGDEACSGGGDAGGHGSCGSGDGGGDAGGRDSCGNDDGGGGADGGGGGVVVVVVVMVTVAVKMATAMIVVVVPVVVVVVVVTVTVAAEMATAMMVVVVPVVVVVVVVTVAAEMAAMMMVVVVPVVGYWKTIVEAPKIFVKLSPSCV